MTSALTSKLEGTVGRVGVATVLVLAGIGAATVPAAAKGGDCEWGAFVTAPGQSPEPGPRRHTLPPWFQGCHGPVVRVRVGDLALDAEQRRAQWTRSSGTPASSHTPRSPARRARRCGKRAKRARSHRKHATRRCRTAARRRH
jgi:hypothetical protein